ncbi:unnamed protein product, partial [Amoebophrya sp. A25]|eukprot:GSA25T00000699001.1
MFVTEVKNFPVPFESLQSDWLRSHLRGVDPNYAKHTENGRSDEIDTRGRLSAAKGSSAAASMT